MKRCIYLLGLPLVYLPVLVASEPQRIEGSRLHPKESFGEVAMSNYASLMVSKTAHVSGADICGVIRITNTGMSAVTVTAIEDSLEVHFYNNIPPAGLTAGSSPNWFKVADVPIANPPAIAPRKTVTIPYCFPICEAADYPNANSMRNVVKVIVGTRWFGGRSNSFQPPFPDCRACCLPDGSCTNTVPDRCTSAGGLGKDPGSDCATTECSQACCLADGSCSDVTLKVCEDAGGEALGLDTVCTSSTCRGACCQLNGSPACFPNRTQMECDTLQGTFLGPDTTCESEIAACPTGACCSGNGDCLDFWTESGCEFFASGTFLGVGTLCAATECSLACCFDDGSCRDETITACQSAGGSALGFGTTCQTDGTACRPGACCQLNGSPACFPNRTQMECDTLQGTFLGPDTTCESEIAVCPTGACCSGNGDCLDFWTESGCEFFASGTFLGVGTVCAAAECLLACCLDDGSCRDETISGCASVGGTALGFGSTCATDATTCRPGACCQLNGSPACFPNRTQMECDTLQGTFLGPDTTCESEIAACPTGACCSGNGDCLDFWTESGCEFFASGTFLGVGTICTSTSCDVACCFSDGGCEELRPAVCTQQGGDPRGPGTDCQFPTLTCGVSGP